MDCFNGNIRIIVLTFTDLLFLLLQNTTDAQLLFYF